MASHTATSAGTASEPKYSYGPAAIKDDIQLQRRFFTYRTPDGLVGGTIYMLTFTIDRPVGDVWPHFKDFNPWQNEFGHYYSAVVGDIEGQTFRLGEAPNEPGRHQYRVVRVVPEHLIVLLQDVVDENEKPVNVSPDCHVFVLHEHEGKTTVNITFEHAHLFDTDDEEEALAGWREFAPTSEHKWRDIFIPTLKSMVYATPSSQG